MNTIALEFVPSSVKAGPAGTVEEAKKAKRLMEKTGLADCINSIFIPHLIEEGEDRPVTLEEKMDPLATRNTIFKDLPLTYIVAQVTFFSSTDQLYSRVKQLQKAAIEHIVFVGVPRTMADGEGSGMSPVDALKYFRHKVPFRGVILIPPRPGEKKRFHFKLQAGANFALTQLLYSDYIVKFLRSLKKDSRQRPEILLSFGYVPAAELKKGLIRWLIQDQVPEVEQEMNTVSALAALPFKEKKSKLVELYKQVVEGVGELGFPLGLHFECPYGFSEPAMETFHAMLDAWSPESCLLEPRAASGQG
jgi:5,10-methylenetetrahydrofolate reductase